MAIFGPLLPQLGPERSLVVCHIIGDEADGTWPGGFVWELDEIDHAIDTRFF